MLELQDHRNKFKNTEHSLEQLLLGIHQIEKKVNRVAELIKGMKADDSELITKVNSIEKTNENIELLREIMAHIKDDGGEFNDMLAQIKEIKKLFDEVEDYYLILKIK